MKVELTENLIGDGITYPKGTVMVFADDFATNLIARGIAMDAGIGEQIRKLHAEGARQIEEAKAKAAEAEAARAVAAAKVEAEAKAKAEEARGKLDERKRGTRGHVVPS